MLPEFEPWATAANIWEASSTMTVSKAPLTAGNVANRRFVFRLSDVGVKTEKRNRQDKSCLSSFLTFSQILWSTGRVWCQHWPATHLLTFDLWPHPPRWLLDGAKIHTCKVGAQEPFHSPFAAGNWQTIKKKDINSYLTRALKETLMTSFVHRWVG